LGTGKEVIELKKELEQLKVWVADLMTSRVKFAKLIVGILERMDALESAIAVLERERDRVVRRDA
jgi:hypothetical protein